MNFKDQIQQIFGTTDIPEADIQRSTITGLNQHYF